MLSLFQIHKQSSGGNDAQRIYVNGKTLEGIDPELLPELLHRIVVYKRPFFQRRDVIIVPELLFHSLFISFRDKQFLRGKRRQKRGYIVQRAFGDLESAGRDIQKSRPAPVLLEGKACQIVMLFLLQELVAEGNSRSDELCHTSFDYLSGKFRIFQLVTDRHLVSCPHEPRKIHVYGMVGKAGKRHGRGGPVCPLGQHDTEYLAGNQCIVRKGLVKISHTEKQHSLRIFGLDTEILLHQRRLYYLVSHI